MLPKTPYLASTARRSTLVRIGAPPGPPGGGAGTPGGGTFPPGGGAPGAPGGGNPGGTLAIVHIHCTTFLMWQSVC